MWSLSRAPDPRTSALFLFSRRDIKIGDLMVIAGIPKIRMPIRSFCVIVAKAAHGAPPSCCLAWPMHPYSSPHSWRPDRWPPQPSVSRAPAPSEKARARAHNTTLCAPPLVLPQTHDPGIRRWLLSAWVRLLSVAHSATVWRLTALAGVAHLPGLLLVAGSAPVSVPAPASAAVAVICGCVGARAPASARAARRLAGAPGVCRRRLPRARAPRPCSRALPPLCVAIAARTVLRLSTGVKGCDLLVPQWGLANLLVGPKYWILPYTCRRWCARGLRI